MISPKSQVKEWPGINELVKDIKAGRVKASDLVQECLENIKKTADFNAVLSVSETALAKAKEIDAAIASGQTDGKLLGVPFIAKDNFLTFGTTTTAASKILENFEAPYQATAIERLEAEGAIMVAKANLDEFAHGSSTENSAFGPTKNPHDATRVPGGSSGGSAAAVALGLVPFALGTDTGGSIRLPASFCGIVGLKPTYGLVSRYGVIAMASSCDVIGPLTQTVEDAAYVLDVLAGQDPKDSTTIKRTDHYDLDTKFDISKLRIGLIREHMQAGLDAGVKEQIETAVNKLKTAGAKVEEVSLPNDETALAVYYIVVPAEVSSNLARYDGIKYGHSTKEANSLAEIYEDSRGEGFGDEPKRRILTGTYVLSSGYQDAYYKQAQSVRTIIREEYEEMFKKFDILIGPTAATPAFKLGEKSEPLSMYLTDITTTAANLAGIPAISIPAGEVNGLPVGLQILAAQKQENTLLNAAKVIEELV